MHSVDTRTSPEFLSGQEHEAKNETLKSNEDEIPHVALLLLSIFPLETKGTIEYKKANKRLTIL